jgi:Heparinase II/III-like protein
MTEGRSSRLGWYARWAAVMSPAEVVWRACDHMLRQIGGKPSQRPSRFADAGITLLCTSGENEIWCRCDGGQRGHLSIAAHACADALSVEVRYAGVDILAYPGTFCYHGECARRSYFRTAIAHNTAELGSRSQSGEGGPFRWVRSARTREIEVLDDGDIARWTAEHNGYTSLDPPALHRRSVLLDRASRSIDIIDQIDGSNHDIRMAFHLGPAVRAELQECCAALDWTTASTPGKARLELPPGLRWSLHRGETHPILGWYCHGLGRRVPAVTLLGSGRCVPGMPLITRLEFLDVGNSGKSAVSRQAISWTTSAALQDKAPEIQAEAPASPGPAEVHTDRAAAQRLRGYGSGPEHPRCRCLHRTAVRNQPGRISQPRREPVPGRHDRYWKRPRDGQVRVVEGDRHVLGRVVGPVDHVRHICGIGERLEAVGAAGGHVEGCLLVVAKIETLPVAVRWRGGPQVHYDVEDGSVGAAHQLRLAVPSAHVQSAYYAAYRAGQTVLDERVGGNSGRAQHVRIESAAEKAAVINVRARLQQQSAINARNRADVHEASLPAAEPMLA